MHAVLGQQSFGQQSRDSQCHTEPLTAALRQSRPRPSQHSSADLVAGATAAQLGCLHPGSSSSGVQKSTAAHSMKGGTGGGLSGGTLLQSSRVEPGGHQGKKRRTSEPEDEGSNSATAVHQLVWPTDDARLMGSAASATKEDSCPSPAPGLCSNAGESRDAQERALDYDEGNAAKLQPQRADTELDPRNPRRALGDGLLQSFSSALATNEASSLMSPQRMPKRYFHCPRVTVCGCNALLAMYVNSSSR